MATFDVDVDDSSPLISYAPVGAWIDSPIDALVSSYWAASLHATRSLGASARIDFSGTGISIFGGKRPNYGNYTLSVDGITIMNSSARSDNVSVNQLLGEVHGLAKGQHTAVLTNTGDKTALDIDRVRIQSQVGTPRSSVVTTTIDDSDPQIQWEPSESDWLMASGNVFFNSTLHFSSFPSAQASTRFSGEALAIYGSTSPDHADVLVQIDGQSMPILRGSRSTRELHPQTLLFFADSLSSQPHDLVISSLHNAPYIDIDSITIYGAIEWAAVTHPPGNTFPSVESHAGNSFDKSKHLAIVIGSAIGATVAMVVFLALCFFLIHRRKCRAALSPEVVVTPSLPIQKPSTTMMEAPFSKEAALPVLPHPPKVFFARSIRRKLREKNVLEPMVLSPTVGFSSLQAGRNMSRSVSPVTPDASKKPMLQPVRKGFPWKQPTTPPWDKPNLRRNIAPPALSNAPRRPARRPPMLLFD